MIKRAGGFAAGASGSWRRSPPLPVSGSPSVASANNLDRRTATDFAKHVAKQDCHNTTGCPDYFVRRLHRVSRHKAVGKIAVVGKRQGVGFVCVRQIVIKLDHFTGDLDYGVSRRRCQDV